ncbi:hypothetical protein DKL61_12585 [Gammaproteobacteria bacterium ESL0073]|nr:hypothetical protein DKL61_12585 [Gammaproteobacteria bacterium ESL0073]
MQLFRHKTKQFHFVFLSLFAILMLTFGPFTSQLLAAIAIEQKVSTNSPFSHGCDSTTEKNHHLTNSSVQTKPINKMPAHHSMSLCGYCDLLHTPIISTFIPFSIQSLPVHQQTIQYHAPIFFLLGYNYPLSQAPPFFS